MIFREIDDPGRRTDMNRHPGLRTWVYPGPVDDYNADCPACLRGRDHTLRQHEQAIQRATESK